VERSDETSGSDRAEMHSARRTARLAAVQALYQIEIGGESVELVLREFPERLIPNMFDENGGSEIDRDFFTSLVCGVAERRAEIDQIVAKAMMRDLAIERLEPLLKVVMRAGAYELMARSDVPARVALAEHVSICHAFFGERETGLVNGVLDRIARMLRPEEMEAKADDAAPAA
jgi:N utilization substance protein B